jgi:SAM-dependent methyltransferase
MAGIIEAHISEFSAAISTGSWFLSEESDIQEHPELIPYAHYLRQAWNELNLSGILCVDSRPTVYLCAGSLFSVEQKRQRHRFVWNQGLVPILIFLTPSQLEVHSAIKKPELTKNDEQLFGSELSSLIPYLEQTAQTLEAVRLVRSIETGQFFQDFSSFFPADEAVDRCLVENLVYTSSRLKGTGWDLPKAHALLGRALFVSFLHEREFIRPDYYPEGITKFIEMLQIPRFIDAKRLLYKEFFPRLRQEFNGTMFDTALSEEERSISKIHLDILRDFLSGHDMKTGQMTLEFWAYDFRFIPVETISAIYEEFMKDTDLTKKRREGAYYTPRHLAETTLHIALENRYSKANRWRVLDPACGSGIFLVAMFNLLAEQWVRGNSGRRTQTRAQALLDILLTQIRGVDLNPEACRITAFSLYLALFEKLRPIDIEEFKEKVNRGPFLPPLLWSWDNPIDTPVVLNGDFLKEELPLDGSFDLIIGNPPWESRGSEQIALHFVRRSAEFLARGAVVCLLLPSALLVNRHGTLDGDWFREFAVEKIVQLADFRFVLFEATHPCFVLRYVNATPSLEHTISYETPKLSRFDRRQGVIVVEPDDQKIVPQCEVVESALQERLQALWSRKFWGTPRDEAFLRRLDFYPRLSEAVSKMEWRGGVGCQPYYPGASQKEPVQLKPWKLTDNFIDNRDGFPQYVLVESDCSTLKQSLQAKIHRKLNIEASLTELRRKPKEDVFAPPMVVYSKGFTKAAFCNVKGKVRFFDGLRSITGRKRDIPLLQFLSVVISSRLFKYVTFHSGSNSGIARDQIHVYETLALPFPLPDDELASSSAEEIIAEAADILTKLESAAKKMRSVEREALVAEFSTRLEQLVEAYFSVTDTEKILISETLTLSEPSIHRSSLDGDIPTLTFPEGPARKEYADTLCSVLNRRTRKDGIKIRAEGMASKRLNLILISIVFGNELSAYRESKGEEDLWHALHRVEEAAQRNNGSFNYLRGFSYFEPDRLHWLKPGTMRNWSRTAALNDADSIFDHLASRQGV